MSGMFGARDMTMVYELIVPTAVGNRVHDARTNVVQDLRDSVTKITARLDLVVHLDVSQEEVVLGGDAGLVATVESVTRELERLAAESFAAMLAERERDLREQIASLTDRVRTAEGYVDTVRDAWELEGPAVEVHRKAQRDLRHSWPALAFAVSRISEGSGS